MFPVPIMIAGFLVLVMPTFVRRTVPIDSCPVVAPGRVRFLGRMGMGVVLTTKFLAFFDTAGTLPPHPLRFRSTNLFFGERPMKRSLRLLAVVLFAAILAGAQTATVKRNSAIREARWRNRYGVRCRCRRTHRDNQ